VRKKKYILKKRRSIMISGPVLSGNTYLGGSPRTSLYQAWILTQAAVSSWLLRATWVRKKRQVWEEQPLTVRGYWHQLILYVLSS
jgi:hypothetical protein